MFRRVTDEQEVLRNVRRRQAVADGLADFSKDWLVRSGLRVFAIESGRHLEVDESVGLSQALARLSIKRLVAVVNDPLIIEDEVWHLDATASDLDAFSDELSGINVLLLPFDGEEFAAIFCTDDFHLVAGNVNFIQEVVGSNLIEARRAFIEFGETHIEQMQPILRRAARYMDWVEDDSPELETWA